MTKLTKQLAATLAAHMADGCTYKTACGACGVDYSTLKRWLRDPRRPHRALRAALRRARFTLEADCLRCINIAAIDPKYWTAAAWLLQHRVGGPYLRSAIALRRADPAGMGGFTAADAARALAEAEAPSRDEHGPAGGDPAPLPG